ncbi:MAG TPA: TetR/AcrR family transcriptional regulator [Baekduia sp.]|nr:TetR/AcrR family transcriptional regulator [Baekduia sp.]
MPNISELTRPVVLREGAAPVPISWPPCARSRLLAAMAQRAAISGFLDVTVDDVIVAARASRRTFYEHFANREECLLASYDAICDDAMQLVGEAEPGLQPALAALLRYFAQWPAHARVLCVDILAAGPAGLARHEATMAQLAAEIVRYQDPAERPAPGMLRSDDVAHAVLGAVHRIVQRRLIDGRHASLPRLAPAICTLLAAERREAGGTITP